MTFEFGDIPDIVENIVGYLPLGIVLGRLGVLRAISIAGMIAASAEISQLVMAHRDPSLTDIAANLVGAALGVLASARWTIRSPALRIDRWKAGLAVVLALALVLHVRSMAGDPVSPRGATAPGALDAYWKLDEDSGRTARIRPATPWTASSARNRPALPGRRAARPCSTAPTTSTSGGPRRFAWPGA